LKRSKKGNYCRKAQNHPEECRSVFSKAGNLLSGPEIPPLGLEIPPLDKISGGRKFSKFG
jgi:hypothetical protein